MVNETVARVRSLGPFDGYHGLAGAATPADDPFAAFETSAAGKTSAACEKPVEDAP